MSGNSVGISDIHIYIPPGKIGLEKLKKFRVENDGFPETKLQRAIDITGQKSIRFPLTGQDSVTLAADAAFGLLKKRGDKSAASLRYIAVGTETSVDHSKPISAYVQGMLQRSGVPIPSSLSSFQVQHACAGGTVSLLGIGALLQTAGRGDDSGLVICSDIARYTAPSTAEITQGAGAVAMYLEKDPELLEFQLDSAGYCSNDVDDFFRPLGSITAKVKGGYSVQCYHEAFDSALVDHAERLGVSAADALLQTDIFVLHVPFRNMALTALKNAVQKHLDLNEEDADRFLEERGFQESLEASTRVGNIYSGSAYLAMTFALQERRQHFGDEIVGKNVMIASYGSGNTMMVFRASIAESAPRIIDSWDLEAVFTNEQDENLEAYLLWLSTPTDRDELNESLKKTGQIGPGFFLQSIREDGYREYRKSDEQ
ncbi:hydroxymethylglutaryl-CoA synthase family protein [Spirochaeta dissipatitropha]